MKIALFCDFALYAALKRFKSCNSENSVQNVIFTGNTCFLWQNHGLNLFYIIENNVLHPECAKTYTDDNFRIIGQGRSSFHLSVVEAVYIKTQNPVLCK